jgi:hypothetical protein
MLGDKPPIAETPYIGPYIGLNPGIGPHNNAFGNNNHTTGVHFMAPIAVAPVAMVTAPAAPPARSSTSAPRS